MASNLAVNGMVLMVDYGLVNPDRLSCLFMSGDIKNFISTRTRLSYFYCAWEIELSSLNEKIKKCRLLDNNPHKQNPLIQKNNKKSNKNQLQSNKNLQ